MKSKITLTCSFILLMAFSCIVNAQQIDKNIDTDACTSLLVGKKATADGSTITSHSCDSRTDRTWINVVPARKYRSGQMTKIYKDSKNTRFYKDPKAVSVGEIPQVAETYAYINTAYPVMNEYQLAIGESTFGGKKEMVSDKGLLDCPELYRLALERAKTAREAIKLIDELTKEYGYNDGGECFTFADPNEVWYFEILGPGKDKIGAVWAAVRIPDDNVGVVANLSRIREINLKDPDNFMASDNVFSLAQEMGFWKPESGKPFEFCYAYADRNSMGCRRREWIALNIAAPSLKLDPNAENYPFSVKTEKKFSIKDVLDLFRNYYQDTEFDMTANITSKDKDGKVIKSPVANPFMNNEYKELFKVKSERTIACQRATYVQITQSRNWLPNEIGGIVWLGYDNPVTTPHTPFYAGIKTVPKSYMVDGREKFRRDCAWWAFRQVSQLCYFRFQEMSKDVEKVWSEIENNAFAQQAVFEKKVLDIYKKDKAKAKKMLTDYSVKMAESAVNRYWNLTDELWSKYTNKF